MRLLPPLLLALGSSCAATGLDPSARISIVGTIPSKGTMIKDGTRLRVVGDYALADFQPGKDRITLVFKGHGNRTWEPQEAVLRSAKGQVAFEIDGKELLEQHTLVRPLQVLLVLDRLEAPGKVRTLRASEVVNFDIPVTPEEDAKLHDPTMLTPQIGKGQLLTDPTDPRYRPHVPPSLNKAGCRYWGVYKLCVDNDGGVVTVKTIKSAHPLVDENWMAVVRRWQHRPYTMNGVPVPYCYPLRLEVRCQQ